MSNIRLIVLELDGTPELIAGAVDAIAEAVRGSEKRSSGNGNRDSEIPLLRPGGPEHALVYGRRGAGLGPKPSTAAQTSAPLPSRTGDVVAHVPPRVAQKPTAGTLRGPVLAAITHGAKTNTEIRMHLETGGLVADSTHVSQALGLLRGENLVWKDDHDFKWRLAEKKPEKEKK